MPKPGKIKPVGQTDKPKDAAKSKTVPPEKVTTFRQRSGGKYANNKQITDILATIECTDETPSRFLADRGIRV